MITISIGAMDRPYFSAHLHVPSVSNFIPIVHMHIPDYTILQSLFELNSLSFDTIINTNSIQFIQKIENQYWHT